MSTRTIRRRTLVAAAGVIGTVVVAIAARQKSRHWGAVLWETSSVLPGDTLIQAASYQTTRAIEINANPATIWPWLVQIGEGRGGFYSFDRLENAAGLTIHSVDRIDPALQHLAVGDIVPLSAYGGPVVALLEPDEVMVLHHLMDPITGKTLAATDIRGRWFEWTWMFRLQATDHGSTRLCIRTRATYAPRFLLALPVALILEPIHFAMERQMLKGIKRRSEQPFQ